MPIKKNTRQETFRVTGENLLKKVKELIQEGNVRKITIKDKQGKSIVEFPLTIGVVGAMIAPVLAAVGALAALIVSVRFQLNVKAKFLRSSKKATSRIFLSSIRNAFPSRTLFSI